MRNRMIVVGLVVLTFVFAGIYYIDGVLEFFERFSLSSLVGLAAIA